jgi:ubiquinone/menaquinone biosynthesis C-methylase UbiE
MSVIPLPFAALGAVAVGAALIGRRLIASRWRSARNQHARRPALWNKFYAVDWGETTTNNYGFAPADEAHPQRFQREMYRQLFSRLPKRSAKKPLKLLEVSCGRGGGLEAFLEAGEGRFDATGLDVAHSAIAYCNGHHAVGDSLRFVQGSALDLPFPDASFDVVLNVEASNDYGDRPRFLREVARVLKPDGLFLYADTCWAWKQDQREAEFEAAGFDARFDDITPNVAVACREDSPRRRAVIRRHAPLLARLALGRQLENYAALEGSGKYKAFADGKRRYLMTAATRS